MGATGRSAARRPAPRALWLVGLLALLLSACGEQAPPEQRLRATVQQLHETIQQRDPSALEDLLAKDFVGTNGLDRLGARRMAMALFLRYRNVGVKLGPLKVQMKPGHATVSFTAALTGAAGTIPDAAQIYDVQTGWREEGGEWRLTSARWTPVL
ncbi:nuclear transport factor 2 family protein [Lysobacter capsici]|uniref:nuclear transport factor 2 family protein n=1 Tax=Lysobacter capsici TaxID=435897 RepID=UPI0012FE7261|nr:nuclear transport factor 2 family protein [Lysobacter capsici]